MYCKEISVAEDKIHALRFILCDKVGYQLDDLVGGSNANKAEQLFLEAVQKRLLLEEHQKDKECYCEHGSAVQHERPQHINYIFAARDAPCKKGFVVLADKVHKNLLHAKQQENEYVFFQKLGYLHFVKTFHIFVLSVSFLFLAAML